MRDERRELLNLTFGSGDESSVTGCVMLVVVVGLERCGSFVVVSIKRGAPRNAISNKAAKAVHVRARASFLFNRDFRTLRSYHA